MDYSSFKMSNKQVEEFARAIFADIETYVKAHKKEYEEFLKTEKSEVTKNYSVIKSS